MKNLFLGLLTLICGQHLTFGQKTINIDDYGKYHNEILSLMYNNGQLKEVTADEMVDKVTSLLIEKHGDEFKNVDVSEIKAIFSGISYKNFNFETFWNRNKTDLIRNGKLPSDIAFLFDKILSSKLDFSHAVSEIQRFKDSNKLTNESMKSLQILENVLESSNQYWNSSEVTNNTLAKHGTGTILADGMGALCFCYSGPLSIICGCVCSMIDNEANKP